jgi:tryptophan-rich sensory protein
MEARVSRYSTATAPRPTRAARGSRLASAVTLLIFLVILAAIAAVEGIVSSGSASGWFDSSAQVVWTPPRALSRAIWAAVFLLLAIAGWMIWRRVPHQAARRARTLYVVALALLTVWPPMYLDGYPLLGVAALWIAFAMAFLLVITVVMLVVFLWRPTRSVALLLVPVAAWLLYISTTNLGDAALAAQN